MHIFLGFIKSVRLFMTSVLIPSLLYLIVPVTYNYAGLQLYIPIEYLQKNSHLLQAQGTEMILKNHAVETREIPMGVKIVCQEPYCHHRGLLKVLS